LNRENMQVLDQISNLKILVVGDVMIDRYWWGTVNRISPEAPVPIIQLEEMSLTAGGAANVAANLAGLGATPYLFGIRGDDGEGTQLEDVLTDAGITDHFVTPVAGRKTTSKTRIVAHSQHVVRIDQETTDAIPDDVADRLLPQIFEVLADADAVIVSDYAKGFLSDHLLTELISETHRQSKLLIVDPKGRDYSRYRGASVITPNKREAADACSLDPGSGNVVARAGKGLMEQLGVEAVLITEGENGMTLFRKGNEPAHLDSLARHVYDVTGAGDTVIATFTAAAAAGNDLLASARLANAAAGLVVGEIGTTRITRDMLSDFLTSAERDEAAERSHA
jgi:D-beta-D-heptose 7-phosphate kinase/D-beta-D-heptose 1-phosphate adenosyltransferase